MGVVRGLAPLFSAIVDVPAVNELLCSLCPTSNHPNVMYPKRNLHAKSKSGRGKARKVLLVQEKALAYVQFYAFHFFFIGEPTQV
jgi:hypothetical protein